MGEVKVDMVRKFALALRREAKAVEDSPLATPMVLVEVTPLLAKKIARALLAPKPRGGGK